MQVKFNHTFLFLVFVSLSISSLSVSAQAYKHEAGFMLDNDFYIAFKQDRYYTTGTFGYFRHALKQDSLNQKFEKKILEIEAGQKIYNPFWSHAPDVNTHDRPFAGYLYAGASLGWFYKNETILKASAQVGILGPAALGKQIQRGFHELINTYWSVEGWEYQVKNEAALNLELSYQTLFYRTTNRLLDFSGSSSALLGNTFSGANAGILIRFGNLNPFYESSYANSRIKNKTGDKRKTDLEFYLFTKPQINFAAYDATIQGGLFRKDKGPVTFGIKNWVYSQQIGLNFAVNRLSAKYIVTLKTKEVESTASAYHYGSFAFAYSFN